MMQLTTRNWKWLILPIFIIWLAFTSTSVYAEQPLQSNTAATDHETNLEALQNYVVAIEPHLNQALTIVERDGEVLQSAENDPSKLCSNGNPHPTFVTDAQSMRSVKWQLEQIYAPEIVRKAVHEPLLKSASLWVQGLESINQYCLSNNSVEQGFLLMGAQWQLGSAVLIFQRAYQNFWYLVVAYGLEALVAGG